MENEIDIPINQVSIIKADEKIFSCSAASIIAKATRDMIMVKMSKNNLNIYLKTQGLWNKVHLK